MKFSVINLLEFEELLLLLKKDQMTDPRNYSLNPAKKRRIGKSVFGRARTNLDKDEVFVKNV